MSRKKGRPSEWQDKYRATCYQLALLGLTDKDMANALGVSEVTFNKWKKVHGLIKSLKKGREIADSRVGTRLYERALGYSHKAVKIFNHEGEPLIVPYTEHYPPDTTACIFWLKNRQPRAWRDAINFEPGSQTQFNVIVQVANGTKQITNGTNGNGGNGHTKEIEEGAGS